MKGGSARQSKRSHIGRRWLFSLITIVAPPLILLIHPERIDFREADLLRVVSWLVCLGGMAALFVHAGLVMRGRAFGILIDERNRFSLSRLQMTLWSVIVLATLYVVLLSNMVRDNTSAEPLDVDVNWHLVVLMGISVATLVASPLALSVKHNKLADQLEVISSGDELKDAQQLSRTPKVTGTVVVKQSPADARFADLIRGEEIGTAATADISRVQMLIVTVIIVVVYALEVWRRIAFVPGGISQFPELSESLLVLISISHGGYIVGKLTPTARGEAGSASAKNVPRALQASQRATDLVRNLENRLASLPDDGRAKTLRDSLTLVRGAAAQASTLPIRVTEPNFDQSEISALEGRLEALSASIVALTGNVPIADIENAPASEKVLQVQQKLRALGHVEVSATGIPDARTENAIQIALRAEGVERKDLHPHPLRFYEELAQLLS